MKKKSLIMATCVALALVLGLAGAAMAAKGGQTKYATGPFSYDPALAGEAMFLGNVGGPVSANFTIYAPSGGTSFPSGDTAPASIRVFGIEKVADADGNPLLTPEDIPLDSALGILIAGAFALTPNSNTFIPGSFIRVSVSVANPPVSASEYGDYIVTMKAQSPGSGVGVGSGSRFKLSLRAATQTDTTPPTVVINSPADGSSPILGPIAVSITANDPVEGTGVASISAKVSSAGSAVTDQVIPLTIAPAPIVPAGTDALGSGTFNPFGGTGPNGTTLLDAFDATTPSGIGSYTLEASASDAVGNTSAPVTSGFQVKYDIQFTKQDFNTNGQPKNFTAQFKFTVKRSSTTSDGAFMFDKTVTVKLVRTSDNFVVSTHVYGVGDIKDNVQIDSTPVYQTNFVKGIVFGATLPDPTQYKAELWFKDVDGTLVKQAESDPGTF